MTGTAFSAVVPRLRTTLEGNITGVRTVRQPWPRVDVEVGDSTGKIIVRFTGRTDVPGMLPGTLLRFEGTPACERGVLVVLNPLYSFVPREDQSA